jgi:ABC-type multidrug transport system fused ATPase/permease subunit
VHGERGAKCEHALGLRRHPAIASESPAGLKEGVAKGAIEVKNIVFKYPSRPNQIILNDYNLKVLANHNPGKD